MIAANTNIYNHSGRSVSLFPQMRPERKQVALKAIFVEVKSLPLNDLKSESGLSNKAWDKGIRALTKHKLANVVKTDEDLIVKLIS